MKYLLFWFTCSLSTFLCASSIFGMICKNIFSLYSVVLICYICFNYFIMFSTVWGVSGVKIILELSIFPFVFTFDIVFKNFQFSSFQLLSHVQLLATPWIAACQPPCPSPTPGVQTDSRPSSWWCHPAISSSVIPFSSCPQSLPESESFPISQLFAWGGQSTGVSALASFLPK